MPLSAVFGWLRRNGTHHLNATQFQLLEEWFWCGVFGEMYGGSTETRFANDLEDCVAWLERGRDGSQQRTVQEAQFQAERLLSLTTKRSAAYKGLYALQMKAGARDFRSGQPIDVHAYLENAIDIHHIFPKAWCGRPAPQEPSASAGTQRPIDRRIADCIVNKTALDARTNRVVGGRAPSVYLARIEENDRIEGPVLDDFLRSHDIEPTALRRDDFAQFFNLRFERLLEHVAKAMGKPVNRSPARDESPFADQETSVGQAVQA